MTNSVAGAGRFVQPDKVVSHFHLKEGDVVADYGAGSGFFLRALTTAVGESGKVYAVEIQKDLVDKLGDQAHLQGLSNVLPLWCDLEAAGGIKVADNELDAIVLVNTLFLIEDKETAITEMLRTLRPGGQFIVVDWTESFAGLGPQPGHVVTAQETTALLEQHGVTHERDFPAGDHHYGIAFKK